MMRKLTATGLAVAALAGFAGTGAAFAASSHTAKTVAGRDYNRSSSNDKASVDKHSGKSDTSLARSSKDAPSNDSRSLESAR